MYYAFWKPTLQIIHLLKGGTHVDTQVMTTNVWVWHQCFPQYQIPFNQTMLQPCSPWKHMIHWGPKILCCIENKEKDLTQNIHVYAVNFERKKKFGHDTIHNN